MPTTALVNPYWCAVQKGRASRVCSVHSRLRGHRITRILLRTGLQAFIDQRVNKFGQLPSLAELLGVYVCAKGLDSRRESGHSKKSQIGNSVLDNYNQIAVFFQITFKQFPFRKSM